MSAYEEVEEAWQRGDISFAEAREIANEMGYDFDA